MINVRKLLSLAPFFCFFNRIFRFCFDNFELLMICVWARFEAVSGKRVAVVGAGVR